MFKVCRKKKKAPKDAFAEVLNPMECPKKIHPILKKYFLEAAQVRKGLRAHQSFELYLISESSFFSIVRKHAYGKHVAQDFQNFNETFQISYEPPTFPFYLICICKNSFAGDCLGCEIMSVCESMKIQANSPSELSSYLLIKK